MAIRYFRKNHPQDRTVDVTVLSDKSEDGGRSVPSGMVALSRPREEPNFDGGEDVNTNGAAPSYRRSSQFLRQHSSAIFTEPTELFSHVSPQIKGAYVDPTLRHTLPTMVGLAMRSMGAEHDTPVADSSLTNFSSALSRNAAKRGLATPHPSNLAMNATYMHGEMPRNTMSADRVPTEGEVPTSEVAAARTWVRDRIRGTQPVKASQRGTDRSEQLKLPL